MAIPVDMTSSAGVTLATKGKYCPDDIRVTPAFIFAENAKSFEYTLTGTAPNSTGVALQDDWLKEHYHDDNLCFYCLKVDDRTNVYANCRCNTRGIFTLENYYGTRFQGLSDRISINYTNEPFQYENAPGTGSTAGFMYITSDGRLLYRNGSNVRWEDGTYRAIAWLA